MYNSDPLSGGIRISYLTGLFKLSRPDMLKGPLGCAAFDS
jgi:hypothetical protein